MGIRFQSGSPTLSYQESILTVTKKGTPLDKVEDFGNTRTVFYLIDLMASLFVKYNLKQVIIDDKDSYIKPVSPDDSLRIAALLEVELVSNRDEYCSIVVGEKTFVDPKNVKYDESGFVKFETEEMTKESLISDFIQFLKTCNGFWVF